MKRYLRLFSVFALAGCCSVSAMLFAQRETNTATARMRAAAVYLDSRIDWWVHWPNAARDHETSCVSCHTALPYAIARPALHAALNEQEQSSGERVLLANVVKRVRSWKDVEPFYPDQTRGLPKTSESRGTESVLNALILATRDAGGGHLSEETRLAFTNMWTLQFKAGDFKGAWAWLNFHYEPWESTDSAYFGAALAAIAAGTAPDNYAASGDLQEQLKLLRDYLQQRVANERLFNRVMALWASSKLPGLLTQAEQQAIVEAAVGKQREDGGWSLADLGAWKRVDGTPLETASDGYATGFVAFALQRAGMSREDAHISKALAWLEHHQDPQTGMWSASSLNKQRDPASDIGKFMSDAATAYAVLALLER